MFPARDALVLQLFQQPPRSLKGRRFAQAHGLARRRAWNMQPHRSAPFAKTIRRKLEMFGDTASQPAGYQIFGAGALHLMTPRRQKENH
jgi:hypothetical protein